jgi:AraC family transcriptional regulator, transcriptional activator of pobA
MANIPVRKIHTSPQEPLCSGKFSIRDVHDLLAGRDMIQELHRHDFFYILALKKGAGNHQIDFITYEICDHSVFFMRPGQVHQLMLSAGSTGYLLQFRPDFGYPYDKVSNQLLCKAGNTSLYQPDAGSWEKLLGVSAYIFQEYTDKQEGHQEVIKAYLNIFFIELIRQHSTNLPNHISLYNQERLAELTDLLETHIAAYKQVSQYANMMHLSTYQLNVITKIVLGKTCSEFINEHIILESKRYLLATSDQVKEIAWHMGYEDVSYFIRFFKKQTGYSPEAFRHHFR